MDVTNDELMQALREGTGKIIKCLECNGVGTKYNARGKSRQCPVCKGACKVAVIAREPAVMPATPNLIHFFGAELPQDDRRPGLRKFSVKGH